MSNTFEQVTIEAKKEKPRLGLERAISEFGWDDKYIKDRSLFVPPIEKFCDATKELGLDSKEVIASIDDAMSLATETFNNFYPDDDKNRVMPYHNDVHANITMVTGIQMFLGALGEMAKNEEYKELFKNNPDLASKMVKTAIYAYALHEYKDWWTKGQDEENVRDWDAKLKEKLTAKGVEVDVNDLGIILELDNAFVDKTLDDSITKVRSEDFKPEFDLGDDFSKLSMLKGVGDENFDTVVLKAFGACLRAADFAQVFNSKYQEEITLVDENDNEIGSNNSRLGSVVLAREFKTRRPKALPKNWVDKDGNMLWNQVSFDKDFYEGMAKPNIMLGIDFMANVNPGQHLGMKLEMEKIEDSFR